MKLFLLVLIAAVTVNCLVTAINGKTASDALAGPYIDMLLPPFEDKVESSQAHRNVKAKVKTAAATTTTTTTKRTTTTKKPIPNNAHNNNLLQLSIEALLPPLFEAKIEEDETQETTTKTTFTTKTTTRKPTTAKPTTSSTTLKPLKIKVADLLLEPLLPPLLDNEITKKDEVLTQQITARTTITTQKPSIKTTKKSYYQQQQQQQQQLQLLTANKKKDLKNFNKATTTAKAFTEKYVAESKLQLRQVSLNNQKVPSNIESLVKQHVTMQASTQPSRLITSSNNSSLNNDKQYNYNFNLFFGSTTPRPTKSGLPTITPFPHRLGR